MYGLGGALACLGVARIANLEQRAGVIRRTLSMAGVDVPK